MLCCGGGGRAGQEGWVGGLGRKAGQEGGEPTENNSRYCTVLR